MFKKRKFLIGGIIVILALSYLAYTGFESSAAYYYTVSEAAAPGNSVYGENLRINGKVAAGSIESDISTLTFKFFITEGGASLPVVYQGVVPDNFKDDSEVVVEGYLDQSGVFQADTILAKCPSKYVPQE
ncbi:MAG: cytochrome c maturation protein CcmE [Chloroflexota bacterium]